MRVPMYVVLPSRRTKALWPHRRGRPQLVPVQDGGPGTTQALLFATSLDSEAVLRREDLSSVTIKQSPAEAIPDGGTVHEGQSQPLPHGLLETGLVLVGNPVSVPGTQIMTVAMDD